MVTTFQLGFSLLSRDELTGGPTWYFEFLNEDKSQRRESSVK
jgi:hypothetical protein